MGKQIGLVHKTNSASPLGLRGFFSSVVYAIVRKKLLFASILFVGSVGTLSLFNFGQTSAKDATNFTPATTSTSYMIGDSSAQQTATAENSQSTSTAVEDMQITVNGNPIHVPSSGTYQKSTSSNGSQTYLKITSSHSSNSSTSSSSSSSILSIDLNSNSSGGN